jgi:thiol-disulfide isomerase/thioredoxin
MDYLKNFFAGLTGSSQKGGAMPNLNAAADAGGSFMANYGHILGMFALALVFAGCSYFYYINYIKPSKEVYTINQEGQENEGRKEAELMFFHVDWCPHCKTAQPEWDELVSQYKDRQINGYTVIFRDINCTEETAEIESMIDKFKIEGYPTIKLIKDGQIIDYDAKPTKETMTEFLNTVL